MEEKAYLQKVKDRFQTGAVIAELRAELFYEEHFEWRWMASKLKQSGFLSFADTVTKELMQSYSEKCLQYALSHTPGMVRGMQNGILSVNVLAGRKIEYEAVNYAMKRPKKHFAAFEMPVIVDLDSETLYYYRKTPLWGAIYYRSVREWIEQKFSI